MRVLVTGGAGFIGSHLVRRLVRERMASVTVVDNFHRGRLENLTDCLRDIRFLQSDIRNAAALAEAIASVDIVYHFAAISSVMHATANSAETLDANVTGTWNVLHAAKLNGVKRVVFASSREVYGDPVRLPVDETAPLTPRNSYGASKTAAEAYCKAFTSKGMEIAVLRLANVYGAGDRDRVIPIFVENALADRPLILYGGEQVIDFVWIDDVTKAALHAGFGPALEDPLNIGSGTGTSMSVLVKRVVELTRSRSRVVYAPSRDAEVKRFVANIGRAQQIFDLEPRPDPLFGLPEVVDWTRHQIHKHQAVRVVLRAAARYGD